MADRELRLELLLGQRVHDANGKCAGRIEEVRAVQQGDDWVIQEYLLGAGAILERLSAWSLAIGTLRLLGARKLQAGYRVPWHQLDLSDPEHPRLRCAVASLNSLDDSQEQGVDR